MNLKHATYVAIRRSKLGKESIVFVHPSGAYCWDKVFEDIERRQGYDYLPEDKSRAFYRALAKELGYQVRRGFVSFSE